MADALKLPEERREQLEDFEQQYGAVRGKLALAMDLMTDAQVSAGQLNIFCRSAFNPARPHPDLEALQVQLAVSRELIKLAFRAGGK